MFFTVAPVPLSAGKRDAISTASVLFTATTAHFSSAAGDAISRKSKNTPLTASVLLFMAAAQRHHLLQE
jgi:hypothetical protein